MSGSAGKERFFFYNTLACMLSGVIGHYVTIEMKNDSQINGRLKESDGFMNMTVVAATMTNRHGNVTKAQLVKVKGSNVRYVHIPSELDPVSVMTAHLDKASRPRRNKYQVKKYGKKKQA